MTPRGSDSRRGGPRTLSGFHIPARLRLFHEPARKENTTVLAEIFKVIIAEARLEV